MNSMLRYVLLTRPYSWMSIVFVAILANIFSSGDITNIIFIDIIFALSVWAFSNFFAEAFSNDVEERGKIYLIIPILILLLSLAILFFRSIVAFPFFLILLLSLVVYSGKSKGAVFGAISFLVRGMMEVNLFIIVLLFNQYSFVGYDWVYFVLGIYSITIARNLIGDIRDFDFDKFTFPKLVGVNLSKGLSVILYLLSIFLFNGIMFSFLIAIILIIFFKDSFYLHRFLVIINSFALFEACVLLINPQMVLLVDLVLIGVLLNFTYLSVPRKSMPQKYL
jgi:hypothetical protein